MLQVLVLGAMLVSQQAVGGREVRQEPGVGVQEVVRQVLFVVRPSTDLSHMQQVRGWLQGAANDVSAAGWRAAILVTAERGPVIALDFTSDASRFRTAAQGLVAGSGRPLSAETVRFALDKLSWLAAGERRMVVLGAPGETGLDALVYKVAAENGLGVMFVQYAGEDWSPGPWPPSVKTPAVLNSNGTQSSIHVRRALVITNQRDLDMLWAEHNGARQGALPKPVVDFEKQSLVAVFAGDKPTHGYSLTVKSINETERSIDVYVGLVSPAKDAKVIRQITQPWIVVPVDKKDGKPVKVYYSE
ncbi:MAG: hypothetical protein AMXMBFR61_27300 [Fimbriimonadales bacterium]